MAAAILTQDRLRELLNYDPETGRLTWRQSRSRLAKAGATAGTVARASGGYIRVALEGRSYLAHRIAWLLHYGSWPGTHLDHIDGNRLNNSIANLRDVPQATNMQNVRAAYASSQSGVLGVHWKSRNRKWCAQISVGGKKKHLGLFRTADEARAAYLEAKRRLHEGCTI